MLDKFTKSLGFIGVNATNMNYSKCEKNIFKFEDENIDKHWRCFYAFYKQGRIDILNEISIDCIQKLNAT